MCSEIPSGRRPPTSSGGLHYGVHENLDLPVTFAVQNLFKERQVIKNVAGLVPQAFQAGYLDPAGRTAALTVRKIF